MPVTTHTVACLRNDVIAKDIYEFELEKPDGFTFKPGQFVLFNVPLMDNPADIQTRAFSIASSPSEPTLLFVAKMIPGGRASRWIAESLKPGSQVSLKAIFGNFTLNPENEKEYLFIATSTGIAPFRSQILDALAKGDSRRMDMIFGARMEEDLFWVKELHQIAQQYPNFFLHLALSNPSEAWTDHKGRVQTLVPKIITDFSQKTIYVCGNPDMTKEVKALALGEWGIDKKDLHVEGYI